MSPHVLPSIGHDRRRRSPCTKEFFVKSKKVGEVSGKMAVTLGALTEGMLRDRS